jgi:(p)ppGpp synthase/HD superfamily hydrolase
MVTMLNTAIELMREHFTGKIRKGNGMPYEAHLWSCLSFVGSYGGQEPVQAAALLHDILRDTEMSPMTLRDIVGDQVSSTVIKLTEDKGLSWYERKPRVVRLAEQCSQGVGIILMADKNDKLRAHCRREPGNPDYWHKFKPGFEDQLWFYQNLIDALQQNLRLVRPGEHPSLRTWDALMELTESFDEFRSGVYWTEQGLVSYENGNSRPHLPEGG